MEVVVPYATDVRTGLQGPYPETKAALEAQGFEPWYVNTGGQPTDYYDLLKRLWHKGETFCIVEQDIVPWPGALGALEACPQGWCGFSYQLSSGYGAWLGCTRFRAEFVRARPGVPEAIAALPDHGTPARYWGRLDTRLAEVLEREGLKIHVHWPAVGHLNPAQQFFGAYNYPCGHSVPLEVMESQPWPYTGPCGVCGQ